MKKNNDTLSNIPKPIEATTLQRAFSISVTCRKISPTTLLTNPYILTIINNGNYQR